MQHCPYEYNPPVHKHVNILALSASYGMICSIMTQMIKMDDRCKFECISLCSIAHMSTTHMHQSTNMCCRYIYMTADNVHQSTLRKTSVLELLQDKNQLLIKTQTLVIVLTYSLTNPQNTAFFLK